MWDGPLVRGQALTLSPSSPSLLLVVSLPLVKPFLKTCSVPDTHSSPGDRESTRLGPYPPWTGIGHRKLLPFTRGNEAQRLSELPKATQQIHAELGFEPRAVWHQGLRHLQSGCGRGRRCLSHPKATQLAICKSSQLAGLASLADVNLILL